MKKPKAQALISSIESGQENVYNFLVKDTNFNHTTKENLYPILEAACMHDKKAIFAELLIKYNVSIPKELNFYIEALPLASQEFYSGLNEAVKLNHHLNCDLSLSAHSVKKMKI